VKVEKAGVGFGTIGDGIKDGFGMIGEGTGICDKGVNDG
jgi:hypothetical protein